MTTLLLDRSSDLEKGFEHDTYIRSDGALLAEGTYARGRLTLDDLITGAWESLGTRGTVDCPVCANPMTSSSPATRGGSLTGVCFSCGSRLL